MTAFGVIAGGQSMRPRTAALDQMRVADDVVADEHDKLSARVRDPEIPGCSGARGLLPVMMERERRRVRLDCFPRPVRRAVVNHDDFEFLGQHGLTPERIEARQQLVLAITRRNDDGHTQPEPVRR